MEPEEKQEEEAAEWSWEAPQEFPVYGLTPGARPPDLESAWEFVAEVPGQPPPAYPQQPAAPMPPPQAAPAHTAHMAPAAPHGPVPQQQWMPHSPSPQLKDSSVPPPSAIGPAMTPEERWQSLFGQSDPGNRDR